jgi:hypothetical protein
VIEIPDSPPTLDLSDVQGDFGLSSIISMTESQSTEQDTLVKTKRRLLSGPDPSRISTSMTGSGQSFTDNSSRLHHMPTATNMNYSPMPKVSPSPSKYSVSSAPVMQSQTSMSSISDSIPCSDPTNAMTSSDTFFPLSVSEDTKPCLDSLASSCNMQMQMDSNIQGGMSVLRPGTPSSGTSDCNQCPVPISGPIPNPGMSPGGSTDCGIDGKVGISFEIS